MNTRTQSETYFEEFCRRSGFNLLPVPVGTGKTPDYTLTLEGTIVIVEVKEVLPTDEERASEELAIAHRSSRRGPMESIRVYWCYGSADIVLAATQSLITSEWRWGDSSRWC